MAAPEVWGATAWKVMHCASFDAEPRAFAGLVAELQKVLPCPHCRESFRYYCSEFPVDCVLDEPLGPARWAWKIHGLVNDKLDKRGIAFSTLLRRYQAFGITVSADEAFGLLFVCINFAKSAASLAACLAAAFPQSDFAAHMRAVPPTGADPFDFYAQKKRAMCVQTQRPLETPAQMHTRCEHAGANFVVAPPPGLRAAPAASRKAGPTSSASSAPASGRGGSAPPLVPAAAPSTHRVRQDTFQAQRFARHVLGLTAHRE